MSGREQERLKIPPLSVYPHYKADPDERTAERWLFAGRPKQRVSILCGWEILFSLVCDPQLKRAAVEVLPDLRNSYLRGEKELNA